MLAVHGPAVRPPTEAEAASAWRALHTAVEAAGGGDKAPAELLDLEYAAMVELWAARGRDLAGVPPGHPRRGRRRRWRHLHLS